MYFFDYLMSEQFRIAYIKGKHIEMLPLTRHQQDKFDKAESCKHYNTKFSDKFRKVRHHNHATGAFIAAVCNSCNLQLKGRRRKVKNSGPEKLVFKNSRNINDFYDIKNFPKTPTDNTKYQFHIPVVGHNISRFDCKFLFKYFNPRVAAEFGKK